MKIPDPRFVRYWVRLRQESSGLGEGDLFWGKPISLYDWAEYTPDELLQRGSLRLSVSWKLFKNDRKVEVEGQLADGRRVPVSPWLVEEQRRSDGKGAEGAHVESGAGVDLRSIAAEIRTGRQGYEGRARVTKQEIAHCCRVHRRLSSDETLEVFRQVGERVRREQLSWLVRNGKAGPYAEKCRLRQ
jgi:hypothetical protein